MSKVFVAALASVLALTVSGAAFAADDTTPAPAPTEQAQAPAAAVADQSAAPASKAPAAQAPKKKADSDVICKPDAGTGSRVGGMKICLTRKEWRERED